MTYLLFCGNVDYPAGGADDYASAFTTITEAKEYFATHSAEWAHIATFDGSHLRIVCAYGAGGAQGRTTATEWHDCHD